jgi:hypothetical protein
MCLYKPKISTNFISPLKQGFRRFFTRIIKHYFVLLLSLSTEGTFMNPIEELLKELESSNKEAGELDDILTEQIHYFQRKREYNALTDTDKRAALRLVFSFIDMNVWWLKEKAKRYNESHTHLVGLSLLSANEVSKISANQGFIESLKFSFKVYGKSTLSGYQINLTKRGWKLLEEAIGFRDRLIHPKTLADLDVAIEKLDKVFYVYPLLGFEFHFARLYGIQAMAERVGASVGEEVREHICWVKEQKNLLNRNVDINFAKHRRS